MLNTDGIMICAGVPPEPTQILGFNLIFNRRSIGCPLIVGSPELQEMLDYCAEHNITPDVEVIPTCEINNVCERMLGGYVCYRL
jgi:uncharacterized zinc-type alcohol dehydrogenase-like protein